MSDNISNKVEVDGGNNETEESVCEDCVEKCIVCNSDTDDWCSFCFKVICVDCLAGVNCRGQIDFCIDCTDAYNKMVDEINESVNQYSPTYLSTIEDEDDDNDMTQ